MKVCADSIAGKFIFEQDNLNPMRMRGRQKHQPVLICSNRLDVTT